MAYFWRTRGSSCGRYWVLLNKSSTSASALITAQLWPARPPGSVCVCVCVDRGGCMSITQLWWQRRQKCVCVFVPFCLCVCWDIKRLSGPLPWCSSIQEGLGGWRHLWSFGKTSRGMTAGRGRTKVVLVSVTWQASESGERSGAKKWRPLSP